MIEIVWNAIRIIIKGFRLLYLQLTGQKYKYAEEYKEKYK